MRKLFLLIPVSGAVILALVAWRMSQPPVVTLAVPAAAVRPAPRFRLHDEESQLVNLDRYLGRHKLLLIFFGTQTPDESPLLERLRQTETYLPIHKTGAIVLAIGAMRPSRLRPPPGPHGERTPREPPFPFELLADFEVPLPAQGDAAASGQSERIGTVHQLYGAVDSATNRAGEAVFVVDRAGIIRHAHLGPDDLGTPQQWADELQARPLTTPAAAVWPGLEQDAKTR